MSKQYKTQLHHVYVCKRLVAKFIQVMLKSGRKIGKISIVPMFPRNLYETEDGSCFEHHQTAAKYVYDVWRRENEAGDSPVDHSTSLEADQVQSQT